MLRDAPPIDRRILRHLRRAGRWMTPREAGHALGYTTSYAARRMRHLWAAGHLHRRRLEGREENEYRTKTGRKK